MLRFLVAFVAAAVLLASPVFAAINADQITNLPGYGTPPTRQWSGLIAADDAQSVFLHYWYVESANNPTSAPLLLWLNGGPGCSSLEGFLYENGPLHFNGSTGSDGIPQLIDNPNAWTNAANVLYLESPAGVGFSYYANGTLDTNDEITSQNNYNFLLNFFKGFPELASLDFYITGESYAGIYIPTLADRIRLGNAAGNAKINLIGFAVGNGCWGNGVGACAFSTNDPAFISLDFFHGHAWVSEPHWAAVISACGNISNPNPTNDCLNAASDAMGDFEDAPYNVYNIYNDCPNLLATDRAPNGLANWISTHTKRGRKHLATPRKISTSDDCTSPELGGTWLDNPTVQKALHVTASNLTDWEICNDDLNEIYGRTVQSLLPLYPTLLAQYKVLVYSGETDACVPYTGSQEWVRSLGYPVSSEWQAWSSVSSGMPVGYQVQYTTAKGFRFLTVLNAGHMVPQYQPQVAYAMISGWLNGTL